MINASTAPLLLCFVAFMIPSMRKIAKKLERLSVAKALPPSYYKREAQLVMKKYDRGDSNFKHFFTEIVREGREYVDVGTLRDTISQLQRYTTMRMTECSSEEPVFLRNKLKVAKKAFRDS